MHNHCRTPRRSALALAVVLLFSFAGFLPVLGGTQDINDLISRSFISCTPGTNASHGNYEERTDAFQNIDASETITITDIDTILLNPEDLGFEDVEPVNAAIVQATAAATYPEYPFWGICFWQYPAGVPALDVPPMNWVATEFPGTNFPVDIEAGEALVLATLARNDILGQGEPFPEEIGEVVIGWRFSGYAGGATCGDSIVQPELGETCDPPGTPAGGNGNDCRDECTVCGDTVLDDGEECDDGDGIDTNECTNGCADPVCGDGIVTPLNEEECDDGNDVDDDGCTNTCLFPVCGDLIVTPLIGETCDPSGTPAGGNGNDCRFNCTACGDGIVDIDTGQKIFEDCDDGNGVDEDECTNGCTFPVCGDGIVTPLIGETCDPQGAPAGGNGNDCRFNCTVCGDGIVDVDPKQEIFEECDDGNGINDDDCSNDCFDVFRADLAITKTDGSRDYIAGVDVNYTIVVTNNGPDDVFGAEVADLVLNLPQVLAASWTCVPSGAATCTTGPVNADLFDFPTIPLGDFVTYTLSLVTDPAQILDLTNTATVAPPFSTIDPVPGNNTAVDTNTALPAGFLISEGLPIGLQPTFAADLDGDLLVDVLSGSVDGVSLYRNDGVDPPKFVDTPIPGGPQFVPVIDFQVADVDGDGNADMMVAEDGSPQILGGQNLVRYYRFEPDSGTYIPEDVTQLFRVESVWVADIDGVPPLDVVVGSFDGVAWYQRDPAEGWLDNFISFGQDQGRSVFVADIDGDLDADVVASLVEIEGSGGHVAWFENNAGDPKQPWIEHFITSVGDLGGADAGEVYVGDFDGDLRPDVVSAISGVVTWYENAVDVDPDNWVARPIDSAGNGAVSVFAADINGDLAVDVVTASPIDDTVAWYENGGEPVPTWTRRLINVNALGAQSVFVADLDADLDLDIISASSIDNNLWWYPNVKGQFGFIDAKPQPLIRQPARGTRAIPHRDTSRGGSSN